MAAGHPRPRPAPGRTCSGAAATRATRSSRRDRLLGRRAHRLGPLRRRLPRPRRRAAAPTALDFFVAAPGVARAVRPARWTRSTSSSGRRPAFWIGLGSCAVPGTAAGVGEAHRRFGSLPWGELVEPGAALARDGVEITPQHALLQRAPRRDPDARCRRGARCSRPTAGCSRRRAFSAAALARTLDRLAETGVDDLYRGASRPRSTPSRATWAACSPPPTSPPTACSSAAARRVAYRGHAVTTNAPPSSGGALMAHALALADRLPPGAGPLGGLAVRRSLARRARARRSGAARRRSPPRSRRRARRPARPRRHRRRGAPGSPTASPARGRARCRPLPAGQRDDAHLRRRRPRLRGRDDDVHRLRLGRLRRRHRPAPEQHARRGGPDRPDAAPRPGVRLTSMMAPTRVIGARTASRRRRHAGSARIRSALVARRHVARRRRRRGAGRHRPAAHPPGPAGLDCEPGFADEALAALRGAGRAGGRVAGPRHLLRRRPGRAAARRPACGRRATRGAAATR